MHGDDFADVLLSVRAGPPGPQRSCELPAVPEQRAPALRRGAPRLRLGRLQRLPLGHLHRRAPPPLRLARRRDHAALRASPGLHAAGPALRVRHRQRQLGLAPFTEGIFIDN